MRYVHGLITLLAAILVIALGGSWLLHRFELGPELGIWNEQFKSYWYESYELGAVPVRGAGTKKLTAPVERPTTRGFDRAKERILPVGLGSPEFSFGLGFSMMSARDEWTLSQGGGCRSPTVNLLKIEPDGASATPLFDRRVMIPLYAYYTRKDPTEERVLVMVIESDTNNDGNYSCDDHAHIAIISLKDGSTKIVDRVFEPSDLSRLDFDGDKRQFQFVERKYIDDAISQTLVTISFEGEIISETTLPNLLSGAKKAFERTSGD